MVSPMKTAAFLLAILSGATFASAQTAAFAAVPTEMLVGMPVYDPHRNVTVLFSPNGTLWEWDGSHSRARLGVADPGIGDAVYDPIHREILTSGGSAWNGVSWRSTLIPSGWSLGAMAYDVARQRLVRTCAINGIAPSIAEFDGQQWTRITPPASPGIGGSLVYDPTRNCCVLAIGNPISLWTWDGSAWSLLSGNGPAAPTSNSFRVSFDPATTRLIVHGGSNTNNVWVPATWAFDASGWTMIPTPATFSSNGPNLAWDGIGMLRMGATTLLSEGVWRLEGSVWRQLPFDYPTLRSASPAPAMASAPTRPGLLLFGGSTSYTTQLNDTWIFDGAWTRQTPQHSPSPRGNAALAWSPTSQEFVLFGGQGPQSTALFDTWTWNGTDWTQQSPATPPGVALQLVTDPLGGVLGLRRYSANTTNDQWLWNGTNWINQPSLPASYGGASWTAVHDPHRNRVVVGAEYQHWEWDGIAWTQIGMIPNTWTGTGPAVFRPDTQRVMFRSSFTNSLLEWDGTTWTTVTIGNWSTTTPATLAPDYPRNRLVSFQHGTFAATATHAVLTTTPASAQRFGYGCALGPSPGLLTDGRPIADEPDFGIQVSTLAANAPCLLTLGFLSQGQQLGSGCVAWILQPPAVHFLTADATGHARLPVPIPADLSLRGINLLAQAAVFDPPRSLFGGLTFTDGLRITIGD